MVAWVMKNKKRVFVASSSDLEKERKKLKELLHDEGFKSELWEDFDHSIQQVRFQTLTNENHLNNSDVVIFMVKSRLGDYTLEEFQVAYENLGTKIERIYIYFIEVSNQEIDKEEQKKIWELQEFLAKKEEKLYREIKSYTELENHFLKQIKLINKDIKNKKTPIGVEEISENKNEKLKYKQYLSNNELPYISRSRFKIEQLDNSNSFQTEDDYYNSIFTEESQYEGIFISGEGGVGKTRLMYELGREAQKRGWITYQIFPNFKGWDNLELDSSKKYCFLFDYVEENNFFEDDIIELLNREYSDISIKIVANARNTYLLNNEVNDSLFNIVDLDISDDNEYSYLKYVILEIFKSKGKGIGIGIELDNKKLEVLEKYISKPSFAVFLLHGLLKDETIDFHDISEFSNFIKKRLALTFKKNKFLDIESKVFHFLFSLPIKSEMNNKDMDDSIIALLEHDGWIEHDIENDVYKSAYNDTIMDEVLIAYLGKRDFKREVKLKNELVGMFDFAIKYSHFSYIFRALDRISDKSILCNKKSNLLEVFNQYSNSIKEINSVFGKSSLLSSVDKIKFFLHHEIIEDDSFIYVITLSKAIKTISKNDENYSYICRLSREWLNSNVNHENFSFLAYEYLLNIKDISSVNESIKEWLNYNITNRQFSYVAYAYLSKIKNIYPVKVSIEEWLNYNTNNKQFSYVAYVYLSKVKNIYPVKESIEEWINYNITHEKFSYVSYAYLSQIKNISIVENSIENWINSNTTNEKFSYVVSRYLYKIKDTQSIKYSIEEWINNNVYNYQFPFILVPYLVINTLYLDVIKIKILKFLKSRGYSLNEINHAIRITIKNDVNNQQKLQPLIDLIDEFKLNKETP